MIKIHYLHVLTIILQRAEVGLLSSGIPLEISQCGAPCLIQQGH